VHQNPMNSLRYEKMRSEFAKVGLEYHCCPFTDSFEVVARNLVVAGTPPRRVLPLDCTGVSNFPKCEVGDGD